MAHEITINTAGVAEMAYAGATPWHGLGQALDAGAGLETWQAAAGMDWRIQRATVRYATGHGQDAADYATLPDRHVLLRSDTKAPLGIVSDGYKIVQPKAVLEFFRDLTQDQGFTLETAGTLFGGKRFWALAKIGAESYVADKTDTIKGYLLLTTSADGSLATTGKFLATRVVCNNTLTIGMKESGGTSASIRHRSVFSEAQMKEKLGLTAPAESFSEMMDNLRRLAAVKVSREESARFVMELLKPGVSDIKTADDRARADKAWRSTPVQTLIDMVSTGRGNPGWQHDQGTAYGLVNAATRYVDHTARAQTADSRLDSAWLGRGDALKTRALEMALGLAQGEQPAAPTGLLDHVLEMAPGS
jgi:phage/plasmid-like protein (TIGR03299 family)